MLKQLLKALVIALLARIPLATAQISGPGVSTSGTTRTLAFRGVPSGIAPTGSMANNGAVTFGTALETTLPGGLYLQYPAGAIAAGVPAATTSYYTVMSSSTVGQVFNNVLPVGEPVIPGTLVPFATTGPGAYTGVTATLLTVASYTIPANTLGRYGELRFSAIHVGAQTANAKTDRVSFGGSLIMNLAPAANNIQQILRTVRNLGVNNSQISEVQSTFGFAVTAGPIANVYTTIDTTQDQILLFQLQLATATDWVFITPPAIEAFTGN